MSAQSQSFDGSRDHGTEDLGHEKDQNFCASSDLCNNGGGGCSSSGDSDGLAEAEVLIQVQEIWAHSSAKERSKKRKKRQERRSGERRMEGGARAVMAMVAMVENAALNALIWV
jgi:hypothetical protein